MSVRDVLEGLQEVGLDEEIVFSLDTTNIGGTPTGVAVAAKLERDWSTVTATAFPTNSPTVSGNSITLSPFIGDLDFLDRIVRVETSFTSNGNAVVIYFRVRVRR